MGERRKWLIRKGDGREVYKNGVQKLLKNNFSVHKKALELIFYMHTIFMAIQMRNITLTINVF